MRLKSWESPRSGPRRNDKSKQASARVRQLKKQTQQLRKRLKSKDNGSTKPSGNVPGGFVLGCASTAAALKIG
jgi:cell shape-determining protein MreC